MRVRHAALLSVIVSAFLTLPLQADACGCAAARTPCSATTLETVAVPQASAALAGAPALSFETAHCWDCGGTDLAVGLIVALFLSPLVIVARRALSRRAPRLIPRFDLLRTNETSVPEVRVTDGRLEPSTAAVEKLRIERFSIFNSFSRSSVAS